MIDIKSQTLQTPESFFSRFRVAMRVRHEVTAIHPDRKTVSVTNLETGEEFEEGYDFVTRLGSTLDFTSQTASLTNADSIEVTSQNFGFDLENDVTEVTLDLAQEHYYLEIRPKT